jgi:hypothetical protein
MQLKPIGHNWSYLACRIGHLVPIRQPLLRTAFHLWQFGAPEELQQRHQPLLFLYTSPLQEGGGGGLSGSWAHLCQQPWIRVRLSALDVHLVGGLVHLHLDGRGVGREHGAQLLQNRPTDGRAPFLAGQQLLGERQPSDADRAVWEDLIIFCEHLTGTGANASRHPRHEA